MATEVLNKYKFEIITDDEEDILQYLKASDLVSAVHNFDGWLREYVRHGDSKDWPSAEEIREELWKTLNGFDVSELFV